MKKFALALLLVVATAWWLKGALAPANEGITSGMYIDPVRDAQAVGDVVKDPRGWK